MNPPAICRKTLLRTPVKIGGSPGEPGAPAYWLMEFEVLRVAYPGSHRRLHYRWDDRVAHRAAHACKRVSGGFATV